MMKFLTLIILLRVIWFDSINNSKIDGTYKVIYDKKYANSNNAQYTITFMDTVYIKKQGNILIEKGKITSFVSMDSCILYLIDDNKSHIITPLDSLLDKSFGKPIVELHIKNLDTIAFRTIHLANLHITRDKGIMVRIKSPKDY